MAKKEDRFVAIIRREDGHTAPYYEDFRSDFPEYDPITQEEFDLETAAASRGKSKKAKKKPKTPETPEVSEQPEAPEQAETTEE